MMKCIDKMIIESRILKWTLMNQPIDVDFFKSATNLLCQINHKIANPHLYIEFDSVNAKNNRKPELDNFVFLWKTKDIMMDVTLYRNGDIFYNITYLKDDDILTGLTCIDEKNFNHTTSINEHFDKLLHEHFMYDVLKEKYNE